MSDQTLSKEEAIVIEREIDAPVELVWQMWTVPQHFKAWYGPQGFSVPVAELDVRVGGRHLVCMEMPTPDGPMRLWSTGEYLEVVPDKRLVYSDNPSNEQGDVLTPEEFGMPDHPGTTRVTVELEELNGRTRMTMTHAGLPAGAEGAADGWSQAFDKMAALIEAM